MTIDMPEGMNPEVCLKKIAELERRMKRLEEAVLLLAYEAAEPEFWYESPFEPETAWEDVLGRTRRKGGR